MAMRSVCTPLKVNLPGRNTRETAFAERLMCDVYKWLVDEFIAVCVNKP